MVLGVAFSQSILTFAESKEQLDDSTGLIIEGDIYFERGLYEEAMKRYLSVIRADAKNAEAYSQIGLTFSKMGQHDQAIANCKKAIGLKGNSPEFYYNLGYVYGKSHQYGQAKECFLKTLSLDANFSEVYYNLGVISIMRKDYKEAITNFRKYIDLYPFWGKDFHEVNGCFSCECDKGRHWEELEYSLEMMARDPTDPQPYCSVGVVYGLRGNDTQAIESFHKAINIDPKYAAAYFNLAVIFRRQENLELTKQFCSKAIQFNGKYQMYCYYLFVSPYTIQKQFLFDYDIGSCQRIIDFQLNPYFYKAYYCLGLAYDKLGNIEEVKRQIPKLSPSTIPDYENILRGLIVGR